MVLRLAQLFLPGWHSKQTYLITSKSLGAVPKAFFIYKHVILPILCQNGTIMKFIYDPEKIASMRIAHINNLKLDGYTPSFDKEETKKIMKVHFDLLKNYISNFGLYLWVYYTQSGPIIRWKILRVLRFNRLRRIVASYTEKIEKDYITIAEILVLCGKLNLNKDFIYYFISKTCLSYTIYKSHELQPIATTHELKNGDDLYPKFAQFIYSILVEYTILHNLMFASGLKLKEITTIDRWMEDLE